MSTQALPQPIAAIERTAPPPPPAPPRKIRVGSVDVLRGLVMVIMVLDHVRDYIGKYHFDPTDLTQTSVPIFLTRWITHFCAPTFMLLAGSSAWMAGRRRTKAELARFLASRGLWLVVLEFTVVGFAWYYNFDFELGFRAQVIWAIGISMLALAALVYLPRAAIGVVAVALIAGHNLLDRVVPTERWAALWSILHVPGDLPQYHLHITYPVLPWIGVIAAGYFLGGLFEQAPALRVQTLVRLGVAMTLGFLVLRGINIYGDPSPWSTQADGTRTVLSFLKVTKYPPSLEYLLAMIGPALLVLAAFEGRSGRVIGWLATLGRTPLFFYVAHLYLVHAVTVTAGMLSGYAFNDMRHQWSGLPAGYGFNLAVVYLVWAGVVVALYPACRWFDARKREGRQWWWSYL